jgi:glutathione S-transferase
MLRVWGRRSAFNVQKVLWLVGELGLAHEHTEAGGAFGGLDDPAFLRMNPHGRVPVIDDGGTVVWESHTILRYLAARYGKDALWSEDPAERSRAERWMDWSLATLQPAFMDLFWGFYRTPEAARDWPKIRDALARCARHYRLLDAQLAERPFLGGARFGLADIPAGTSLHRYFALEIERPALPHVAAWHRRLAERPAYRAHVMVPFEALRGRLDY